MDQKISDLDIKIAMEATDIIPVVDSNGENKAINGAQVKDFVGLEVAQDIDAVKDMISDEYDNTATYAVGDYCIYNNTLYRCNTAISTAEDFTPAHWTETSIDAELISIKDYASSSIIIRYKELFTNISVAADTEYNSNGSTIPHVTPDTVAGYTPVEVINVRARGYYGSRGLLYAWFESDNKIHFSLYNAGSRNDATFIGDSWILYKKNP